VIRLQIIASGSGDGVWGRENNQGLLPTSVVLSGWGLRDICRCCSAVRQLELPSK
jgi:hypothetical protein